MDNMNHLDVSDGFIKSIQIFDNEAEIVIEKWNAKIVKLKLKECWRLKDRQSTNREISHLIVLEQSELLDEVIADIIEGGGSKEEVKDAFQITFYEPYYNNIILEIVATSIVIQEMD